MASPWLKKLLFRFSAISFARVLLSDPLRLYDFLGYCLWRPCRTLGDRLRLRREVAGLSRRECAKHLGLDEGTVARIERGTGVRSSQKVLDQISDFVRPKE